MPPRVLALAALGFILLILLLWPPRAGAGTYDVSSGPRKRIPVETVRAGSDGRFRYRYRFRSIVGPSVFRFEARVPKQTGFPYLEGASKLVTVRGRP